MDFQPTQKKLIQVTEESTPVVQVTHMVGNEVFVITQQDTKRVEYIRMLSCSRLTAEGNLLPSIFPDQLLASADEVFTQGAQSGQEYAESFQDEVPETETGPFLNVASIATQMEWSKKLQTSSPFPLHYSVATSTCTLETHVNDSNSKQTV
ncbi:uncharacterized protein LOC111519573 [Drosophila willistoni]|uniref:uncharacterized protein LOC111519573 n=1 Tax=Drosophila willistoni TaxID=7260 RepID=UPI000C26CB45|nr:uncharacterized protein LOC111519573 [Drosophila willistoni]